ncbi:MAG: hypothetical protein OCC45_02790 [Desulfotalea sp.]
MAKPNSDPTKYLQTRMITCQGVCKNCKKKHSLKTGADALIKARWLAHRISNKQNLDIFSDRCDPHYQTTSLWGDARGKMFGVLECENNKKEQVFLYAFSGQFKKRWHLTGWSPPLFDTQKFDKINTVAEAEISAITKQIKTNPSDSTSLKINRKKLSQNLMKRIHSLYKIKSFTGRNNSIDLAFLKENKIPTGTGDCCAPKLLNEAINLQLKPISIAEFFYGRTNKSGSKKHLKLYSSCQNRCQNLLGYILCGLKNDN